MHEPELQYLRSVVAMLVRQVSELKASELALTRLLNELCAVVPKEAATVLARHEHYREELSQSVLSKLDGAFPGLTKELHAQGALPPLPVRR
jgi:hypothetical protein